MPARVNAVLVPRSITRIARRFVKDQRAVNDNVRPENTLNCIQHRYARRQTISPRKKQVQVIKPPPVTFAALQRHGFECVAIAGRFRHRKHANRKQDSLALVSFDRSWRKASAQKETRSFRKTLCSSRSPARNTRTCPARNLCAQTTASSSIASDRRDHCSNR